MRVELQSHYTRNDIVNFYLSLVGANYELKVLSVKFHTSDIWV